MGILFRIHAAPLYERPRDVPLYRPDDNDKSEWRAYDTDLEGLVPYRFPMDDDDPE